jgi:YhgE/Pip-like protein
MTETETEGLAQTERLTREVQTAEVIKDRSVWSLPLIAGSVLVMLMTLIYFGSIVNPASHLRGLPVAVVNEDTGAVTPSGRLDVGQQIVSALTGSRAVSSRLSIHVTTLPNAQARMNNAAYYVTLVIPAGFTSALLTLNGGAAPSASKAELPTIQLLTNNRAGTLGVSLASGVLQPAVAAISTEVGQQLIKASGSSADTNPALATLRANPITLASVQFRPLPSHAGLGLSAFYVSLLITMCGFLGATIVNTSVDAYLGYATSEVGPWWKQRPPLPITRWHTLVAKWIVAVATTPVLTAVLVAVAAGILRMDAPHLGYLWLFGTFAAIVIAIGTLVFFAALGSLGQLLALLVFVYLALASSGGTVPLQALAGFYRFVANFEPLRQILDGVRAILYFNAAGAAGLDRALVLTGIGLIFWLLVGTAVTKWYDHRGLARIQPELLEYVHRSARAYGEVPPPA